MAVVGLQSESGCQHNGKLGAVQSFNSSQDRYVVLLDSPNGSSAVALALKEVNLEDVIENLIAAEKNKQGKGKPKSKKGKGGKGKK